MRILAFDGRMGASGDMILGALMAAGADSGVLAPLEAELPVTYDRETTEQCGIQAKTVSVGREGSHSSGEKDGEHEHDHASHGHEHGSHDHDQENNDHGHGNHDHGHGNHGNELNNHDEGNHSHRTFPEVVELVRSLELPEDVESDAVSIFELLGEAEASIHGTDLEETHFHEVGADDAIADIVGAMALLADLDVDRIVTTPLATGGGEVEMSHGVYPVPAPAVTNIAAAADWSIRGGPVEAELLTPTGAAILAHVADGVETLPSMDVHASGYGAGSRSFPNHPNVLRALVGETTGSLQDDPISVLETHVDDTTPEMLGHLQERLTAVGARDVAIVPLTMKASRPGHLIKVVTKPGDSQRVARTLAAETGTLGVREHRSTHRFIADRSIRSIDIDVEGETYGVDVKIARFEDGGSVFDVSCEYDDANDIAGETGHTAREIMARAEAIARREYGQK